MIIKPSIRNFICTTAHPVGCEKQVAEQFALAQQAGHFRSYRNVLVIGCSTGYGLASRISAAVNGNASTLGVMFEKPPTDSKTATAGWYNNQAFEKLALQRGQKAITLNGDAFSEAMKQSVVDTAQAHFGPFDLVIYSVAAPRRQDGASGQIWHSVLKPIDQPFEGITLDTDSMTIKPASIAQATADEIEGTVKVMGGEDWLRWMKVLHQAKLLAPGCRTLAYNYIGRELTWPIYGKATIGRAKEHLLETVSQLNALFSDQGGRAQVAVLKAVVTQSSSAIPIMPLYISLLFKVMKEQGCHETPMDQIIRLFRDRLGLPDPDGTTPMVRVDELELSDSVQHEVARRWQQVNNSNLAELADIDGYRTAFLNLFGFGTTSVDYAQDIDHKTGVPLMQMVNGANG